MSTLLSNVATKDRTQYSSFNFQNYENYLGIYTPPPEFNTINLSSQALC